MYTGEKDIRDNNSFHNLKVNIRLLFFPSCLFSVKVENKKAIYTIPS